MKLYFETERLVSRLRCVQYFLFKMYVQYSPSLIFLCSRGKCVALYMLDAALCNKAVSCWLCLLFCTGQQVVRGENSRLLELKTEAPRHLTLNLAKNSEKESSLTYHEVNIYCTVNRINSISQILPSITFPVLLMLPFARGTEGLASDKNTLPGYHNPAGSGLDEITVKTPAEHKGPCWWGEKKD